MDSTLWLRVDASPLQPPDHGRTWHKRIVCKQPERGVWRCNFKQLDLRHSISHNPAIGDRAIPIRRGQKKLELTLYRALRKHL